MPLDPAAQPKHSSDMPEEVKPSLSYLDECQLEIRPSDRQGYPRKASPAAQVYHPHTPRQELRGRQAVGDVPGERVRLRRPDQIRAIADVPHLGEE